MLSGEATHTNFKVFGLTRRRPGLELTIYQTRGEHAYHYATDAVLKIMSELTHLLKLTTFVITGFINLYLMVLNEKQKYHSHAVGTVTKYNRKIVERDKIDTSNTCT